MSSVEPAGLRGPVDTLPGRDALSDSQLLLDLSEIALSGWPLTDLCQAFLEHLCGGLDFDRGEVLLEQSGDLEIASMVAAVGWPSMPPLPIPVRLKPNSGYRKALENRCGIEVSELTEHEAPESEDGRIRSGILLPLVTLAGTVGVVGLYHSDPGLAPVPPRSLVDRASRILAQGILARSSYDMKERFDVLAGSLPLLIAYCDRGLVYRYCNQRYVEWFERPLSEIVDRITVPELVGPETFKNLEPHIQKVLGGEVAEFETSLPFEGRPSRHIHTRLTPEFQPTGEVSGYFVLVEDITARREAEAQAAASELRLSGTLASMSDGFLSFDRYLCYTYANDFALKLLMKTREEVFGRNILSVFPDLEDSDFLEAIVETRDYARPAEIEAYYPQHDRWYACRCYPTPEDGVALYFTDVTDRVVAQQRLLDRERRLELAMETAQLGTWDVTIETRETVLDPILSQILGLGEGPQTSSIEELLSYVHDEDRAPLEQLLDDTFAGKTEEYTEFRFIRPDGEMVWLAGKGAVIYDEENGRPLRMVAIAFNITRQKEAELNLRRLNDTLEQRVNARTEALRASEESMRTIVQAAADAILALDPDGRVASVNPAAERIFRADAKTLVGMEIAQLLPQVHRVTGNAPASGSGSLTASDVAASAPNRETLAQRLDGTECPVEYAVSRAVDIPVSILVARDISERRQLESQVLKATEEEKERIARDLHDSLGSLLGGADCLARALQNRLTGSDPTASESAAQIGEVIREGISLTRRLSHGLYAVGARPDALMEALRDFTDTTAQSHQIKCQFDCPAPVSVKSRFVANHLFRIAQEAVTNALKHADAHSVTVSLTTKAKEIVLAIKDDGSGIPPKEDRVEGLGLQTMHYRSRALSGYLDIQTHPEAGTTVVCRAPLSGPEGHGPDETDLP